MLHYLFIPLLGALPLALGASPTKPLPPCGAIDRPCRCPQGTTFKNLTSFGIIGAPTIEVQDIMGSFFDIQYVGGLIPVSTTGADRVVGATRTFNLPGPGGYYMISEWLFKYKTYSDGSFIQGFGQSPDPPVVKIPGGGELHGHWHLIIGQQTVIPNETAVAWKNWRCKVGMTFPAAQAHEIGISNTSDILRGRSELTGVDIEPFTIFHEVQDD